MKRTIVVGVLAAVLAVVLLTFLTFLEMRYSENGTFMRQWTANGRPNSSFDDTMKFMEKWVRIHQFIQAPVASILVGFFVGAWCRTRCLVALSLGVLPIVVLDYPSDVFSVLSAVVSIGAAWLGMKSTQAALKHYSPARHTAVT